MRRLPLPLVLVAFLAGCGGDGGGGGGIETGRVTVHLITPPAGSPDPFVGIASLHVEVRENGTVVYQNDFGTGTPIEILGLTPGNGRTVRLQALDAAGTVVSSGTTVPFDFATGATVDVPLYFARANSFNAVHGTDAARVGAISAGFPDGHVLIAGGLSGGTGLASAALYDPDTDTLTAAGTMSTAHAFTAAVSLANSTVLVAGGASGTGGPTAAADVFVYAGGTGTWAAGVPAMSTPRRDAAAASLGSTHALLAGGDSGNGIPLSSTEVFSWNGSAGSWAAGNSMQTGRMGAAALGDASGKALVCGGFNAGGEGGPPSQYSRTSDIFTLTGATATRANGAGLKVTVGYAGIVALDATTWLLAGGETDGGHTDRTESIHWTGNNLQTTAKAKLPSRHKRGGGAALVGGSVILGGGDTGTRPSVAAVDQALTYDVARDSFKTLGVSPGATSTFSVYPLPDGTAVVVTDAGVMRFNP